MTIILLDYLMVIHVFDNMEIYQNASILHLMMSTKIHEDRGYQSWIEYDEKNIWKIWAFYVASKICIAKILIFHWKMEYVEMQVVNFLQANI